MEPSLDAHQMGLLSPADRLESSSYKQTFWWERTEDASAYRLQIVSPKFDSVSSLVLDTLVFGDKFTYTLDPGKYEWRVRAENGSSFSAYRKRSLIIHPSSLTLQTVQLLSPSNGHITSSSNISFQWLGLFGASRYRLQIDTNSFADSTKLISNATGNYLTFNQVLKNEGKYACRVRAENDSQTSKWSEIRYLTFDATPPEQVTLLMPANKQSATKPASLKWMSVTDAESYQLFAYKSDSVTLFSGYPVLTAAASANFNSGDLGERVIWRVRAIDKAGNKGALSNHFSFVIQ